MKRSIQNQKKTGSAGKAAGNKAEAGEGEKAKRGGKRPGAGRPAIGDYQTNLNMRCNAGQLKAWQAAADWSGQSLSEWIRAQLDKAAARGKR